MSPPGPHSLAELRQLGRVEGARLALLLLHGRGGSADDILPVGLELVRRAVGPGFRSAGVLLAAPQATGSSWYPYSFLMPLSRNQPWLDSALDTVESLSADLAARGVERERQILVGFSQGACLACELVLSRGGAPWGGLAAFTGGYQGPIDEPRTFTAELPGVPALLSCGDPDPHVPFARVEETARALERAGAEVRTDRYPGRPHTVLPRELDRAVELLRLRERLS